VRLETGAGHLATRAVAVSCVSGPNGPGSGSCDLSWPIPFAHAFRLLVNRPRQAWRLHCNRSWLHTTPDGPAALQAPMRVSQVESWLVSAIWLRKPM
jgi:hypothetical protein